MSQLLVPIILIISSIGLFFTYLQPGYDALKAFQVQETKLKDALIKSETVLSKKSELTDQYIQLDQGDLDNIKLMIPSKVNIAETILILDRVAQDSNVYVEEFGIPTAQGGTVPRLNVGEAPPEYGPALYRVTISGAYEGIKRFLYQVEKSVMVMDVVELFIEKPTKAEDPNMYTATLSLQTYRLY